MKKFKKKTGLLWKVLSIVFAIGLWYFVIQVQNPNDIYIASNIDINIINEDVLIENGLCLYDVDDSNLSIRLSGKKVLLGKSRNYEKEIKGVVDLSDYFTNRKLVLEDGEYLPVRIVLPDSLINLATVERQSLEYVKVFVDERIETLREVDVNFESSLGKEYYLDIDRKKIMPQRVELYGAKNIVDTVSKLVANVNISSDREEIYSSKIYAYNTEGRIIGNVDISPENIQVSVPVLMQKTVKLNVNVLNNLSQDINLEEIKISPSEIQIAGTKEELQSVQDTLNIPVNIIEEEGEHEDTQSLELNQNLYNIKGINEVKITYKIKRN